jgi:hypothetical protein
LTSDKEGWPEINSFAPLMVHCDARELGENMSDEAARIAALEQRVEALSHTIKTVMTTFMLRGLLTRETVNAVLAEAERGLAGQSQAMAEIAHIKEDMPAYLRHAMGPTSEDDDHGH